MRACVLLDKASHRRWVQRSTKYNNIGSTTLGAGLLARSQYPEGPATGHLDTGFSLVSLCPKPNAEMVPKIPSCHYMLLM